MGQSVIFVGAGFEILPSLKTARVAAAHVWHSLTRHAVGGLAKQIGVAVGLTGPAVILYGLDVRLAPLKKAKI